jgi:hypothetical protein
VSSPFVWLQDNWFALVQAAGIIFGLVFTGVSLRHDTRARKVSDLLSLTSQHRELWSEVHRRPDLSRIFDPRADLIAAPVTRAEEEFLLVVIVHFTTGWQLARQGAVLTLNVLAEDARWFFNLPIPHAVWKQTKQVRDPEFVRFIDRCLTKA